MVAIDSYRPASVNNAMVWGNSLARHGFADAGLWGKAEILTFPIQRKYLH